MMSRIAGALLMITYCFVANAQQGFYKVFPESDYHNIRDMIAIDENHFAVISSSFFYHVDGSGKILSQKEFKQGLLSTYLESIIRDDEGNFWIAAMIFDNIHDSKKVLYKLSSNGQLLKTVDFGLSASFEYMQLVRAGITHFFLAYKERGQSGNGAVKLALLDKTGNAIWTKQASDTIFNSFSIKAGSNNTADIFYQLKDDRSGRITTVDGTGNLSTKEIQLTEPSNSHYYTNDFIRTSDGFVFCGFENKSWPLLPDGLIYKTDHNGNLIWKKTADIKQSDNFQKIEEVSDGFVILSTSGYVNLTNDGEGDVALMKTDKQGNRVWVRAFGGSKTDYARQLCTVGQQIIFAGQTAYSGGSVSVPFMCKADLQGELQRSRPFETVAATKMKPIETPVQQYASTMIQSAPATNGSVISGGNSLKPEHDQSYPFVVRNDKNAKLVWYKELSDYPAHFQILKQVRPNEYIAITQIKDLFANMYDVYKLDETGKIIWKTKIAGNAIRDVIATRDGGILIAGTLDISFINYETLLVKLDASGNQQWVKTIGDLRVWETGRKIIETPEQDFLIVGSVQGEFDIACSVYLLKIDRQGNKLWARSFTDGLATDIGYDLILTPDQGYLIAGTSNKQPFLNKDLLLIRVDKNGNQVWRKKHDLHLMDEGFQIMNSSGGGFLIAGTTAEALSGPLEKYIYVMKTDMEGRNEGTRYYGKTGLQTMNPTLTVLSTGDTILTGTTQDGYGKEAFFMTTLEAFTPGSQPQGSSINLYPNPSNGTSSLILDTEETGGITIGIYDQTGKLVLHINRRKTATLFREDLNISSLSTGTYFVNVWFNGKRHHIKWLVVK